MRSEAVAIDFECIAVGILQASAESVFTPEGRWNTQVGGPCLDGRAGFHAEAEVKYFARAYRLTLHDEKWKCRAEQLVASDLEVQAVGVPLCKYLGVTGRYAEGAGRRYATNQSSAGALMPACAQAARTVLRSRQARVIGPTPPGTGVMAEATCSASS